MAPDQESGPPRRPTRKGPKNAPPKGPAAGGCDRSVPSGPLRSTEYDPEYWYPNASDTQPPRPDRTLCACRCRTVLTVSTAPPAPGGAGGGARRTCGRGGSRGAGGWGSA